MGCIARFAVALCACSSHAPKSVPPAPPPADASPIDAAPASQTVMVPTRLAIARTADTLTVWVDLKDRVATPLTVDPGLVTGVKYVLRVHPEGAVALGESGGLAGATDFNLGERIFHRAQDGLPVPGTRYVVEMDLAVFETDVPPGHMWSPESGRYRVLWTRTLTEIVD
jgi:hypothetical protein